MHCWDTYARIRLPLITNRHRCTHNYICVHRAYRPAAFVSRKAWHGQLRALRDVFFPWRIKPGPDVGQFRSRRVPRSSVVNRTERAGERRAEYQRSSDQAARLHSQIRGVAARSRGFDPGARRHGIPISANPRKSRAGPTRAGYCVSHTGSTLIFRAQVRPPRPVLEKLPIAIVRNRF